MSAILDNNIKAICLDIDGTLYSPLQLKLRLIPCFFPDIKLGAKFNSVRKQYRSTQEINPPESDDRKGLLEKQAKIYLNKKNPTQSQVQKVIEKIDKQFYKPWEKSFLSIKGFPNMADTIHRAKKEGLKIALLSDFPIAEKPTTLKINEAVDFAITSEDTGYLKPSAKAFLYITNYLELDPEHCLYVGDSYNKDIVGAKNINMQTLFVSNKKNKKKFPKADYICKDWFEIEKVLFC